MATRRSQRLIDQANCFDLSPTAANVRRILLGHIDPPLKVVPTRFPGLGLIAITRMCIKRGSLITTYGGQSYPDSSDFRSSETAGSKHDHRLPWECRGTRGQIYGYAYGDGPCLLDLGRCGDYFCHAKNTPPNARPREYFLNGRYHLAFIAVSFSPLLSSTLSVFYNLNTIP